ncbi:DEAD/DEAH box helicase family protein [Shewanella sp. 10N.286.52.C2]|uniref:DEAD/DEAH box helicase family protein n=1 Tax=Shewanella sp. 10N.286.52.C2 TaxID=1880838 RepID=UPI0012FFE24F|nr:DEAD/DEAH box helicase family protein [Shewanella sp. 10N.286.52.C2]
MQFLLKAIAMGLDGIAVDQVLASFGYKLENVVDVGRLYTFIGNNDSNLRNQPSAILVDNSLYSLQPSDFYYVDYTSYQNQLMHHYQGLLRFCALEIQQLIDDISHFLSSEIESIELKKFGSNREEQHIDPTPPEFKFAEIFESVFGPASIHALQAEAPYIDRQGHKRFIDYILHRKTSPIAIELNGETYHHPLSRIVSQKQYRSQLFKQNSLVNDGYLVYRWSDRGMSDSFKFEDQMKDYFGQSEHFLKSPLYRAERSVDFSLYAHQQDAVNTLIEKRKAGQNRFLVVLPTGSGKTEVFIEDVRQQLQQSNAKQVLAVVPTVALKMQLIKRLEAQIPEIRVGELLNNSQLDITVQTSAYVLRHYRKLARNHFDYILIDEAHRAAADGLRQVLNYFSPKSLLGLTATDERLDKRSLSDIFGHYEVEMTLEQAILKKLVPQIRAFRLESNIDFSKVRFNGKEFVKTDLQKTVIIPSRDQLIADVLLKYFFNQQAQSISTQQGIVFCVDIKHTQRMAKLLNQSGIKAASVSGKERTGLDLYHRGEVQMLCACDLINEGWDSPQTSILVMARPTMSKVLYTQQLGRGTRNYPGKEALYVIDVVDSYGAAITPWSLHGLFNLSHYQPFGDLVKDVQGTSQNELIILDGLWESERRIEPINIFNFEKEFRDLLNEEQLARELFISTGTVKAWMKKGDLVADKTIPFGSKNLNYFSFEQLEKIRITKNIPLRTQDTRKADFIEFIEKRDYTFSYKIILLIVMANHCNKQGELDLDVVAGLYAGFYESLLSKYGKAEKGGNPLNISENLLDSAYIKRNILINPFEKFERKRFFYQCQELNLIAFDTVLWDKLKQSDLSAITTQMREDLSHYYNKLDMTITKEDIATLNLPNLEAELDNQNLVSLPFFEDLKIACGHFKTSTADKVSFIQIPTEYGTNNPDKHFIAKASGNSMNGGKSPILDGDLLLFEWITPVSAGSISNQILAIELLDDIGEPQYLLRKVIKQSQGKYTLIANNKDYHPLNASEQMNTFARFKGVIKN